MLWNMPHTVSNEFVMNPFSLLLYQDKSNNSAFWGIRNIDLNLTLGNYEQAFSSSANVLVGSADVGGVILTGAANNLYSFKLNKINDANLYLNYLSIPSSLKLLPKFVIPYMQYTCYKSSYTNVGTGAQTQTTNNIQLQSVPQIILVYVQDNESARNIQSADTFYPIEKVSVNFSAKSSLLSSASQYQLYRISHDNGIQLDWYSWSGKAKKYIAAVNDNTGGPCYKSSNEPIIR